MENGAEIRDQTGEEPKKAQAEAVEANGHQAEESRSAAADGGITDDFDFDAHRREAVDGYQAVRGNYADCAQAVQSVLKTALDVESLTVLSVDSRAKAIESFGRKACRPSDGNPGKPQYPDPLLEITDMAAVRVIAYLLETVEKVNEIIEREFDVVEKSSRSGFLEEGGRFGYQSVHYLVRFREPRRGLLEYERFDGMICEIQVRTVLQHAWAEIEHDIQYKAVRSIPKSIRRRFASLAGLVEIADREFQGISDEDERERRDALNAIESGEIQDVEIAPEALKAYLDERLGSDGRMSQWSYNWAARILDRLGFENLGEVDACLALYDDDQVSRAIWGGRMGQIQRFEDVLLAAFGDSFIQAHPWTKDGTDDFWANFFRERLSQLRTHGIEVGLFRPGRDAAPGSGKPEKA